MQTAAPAGASATTDETAIGQAAVGAENSPAAIQMTREERVAMLRRGLRRMRTVATLLLCLMTVIFIATIKLKFNWLWVPYVRAFAEAGMVGACADWFAVVALFRHPLGLPIPHTAIVPNNQERIGGALSRFMTNNFLTGRVINERLARIDVVGSLALWLQDPANTQRLARYVALVLPKVIDSLPRAQIGDALGRLAQQAVVTIPAAPTASKLLEIVWAGGQAEALIAQAIEYSQSYLGANKDYFSAKISEQSARWVPKWIDKMIADKVMSGLLSSLTEMRNPKHPWRVELQQAVKELIAQLAADPQMYAKGEAVKVEFLSHPLFAEQAKHLWTELESGLQWGIPSHADAIARTTEELLLGLGRWLAESPERQAQINRRIRASARRLLLSYRFEIGHYIERVVRDWDSTTLVERVELQVGKDLQFIRINGTLVGGLVGVLIFIASKWIAAF
jgi:uncharacterized membrane-anchored protein YjiN (DUF445 family)